MLVRIASDIHVNINEEFSFDRTCLDQKSTLILAGDFCPVKNKLRLKSLLTSISKQFKHAINISMPLLEPMRAFMYYSQKYIH